MDFSGPTNSSSTGGLGVFTRGFTIKLIGRSDTNQQKNILRKQTDTDFSKGIKVGNRVDVKIDGKLQKCTVLSLNKNTQGIVTTVTVLDEFEKKPTVSITAIDKKTGEKTPEEDLSKISSPAVFESFTDFNTFLNELYKNK
jgi:hypothetical protein